MASQVWSKITFDVFTAYTLAFTAGAISLAFGLVGRRPIQVALGLWMLVSLALMVTRRLTMRHDPRESLTGNLGLDGWAASAIVGLGLAALVIGVLTTAIG